MSDKRCRKCGALIDKDYFLCTACSEYDDMQTFRPQTMTNADRIRSMNNMELAAFLDKLTGTCTEQQCDACEIGRIGGICNLHTIHVWMCKRAER